MLHHIKSVLAFTVLLSFFALPSSAAPTGKYSAEITAALSEMIAESNKLGAPKLEGVVLHFGSTRINGNYTIVDALKQKYKCTATFFAKKGDGFVRISTNVIKDDGSRAIGTPLDPQGPVIGPLKNGDSYYGEAEILGKKYETGYMPIKNESGETIGIYYIGFRLE